MARVFTIQPGAPFLPTLVGHLLDGRLIPGTRFRDDPFSLADLTIYLPTRRATRALAGAFVDALGGAATVLPRIRPLGDVDTDDADGLADPVDLDLPPAVSAEARLLGLARLVADWRRFVAADRLLTPAGVPIAVPGSTADALTLARELLALLDQGAAEGVVWDTLGTLVPDDYAAWWQTTLTFLDIATKAWPAHLAESGRSDPIVRRTAVTEAIARRLTETGTRGPVLAAGSTGSVPATARLLAAIAGLPNGAVVLPGLDLDLDETSFAAISPPVGAGVPSHPQATMARLLATIGIGRAEVVALGDRAPALARRAAIISDAMRPAEDTDRWPALRAALDATPAATAEAFAGLALVTAANEAEEALAVAVALRETLETPGATAALVTPDRGLARRVCAELARFGVSAEDSAGTPLARTEAGVLAQLVAETAGGGYVPDAVVSLLKHPLTRLGLPRERTLAAARALELTVLRGPRLAAGGDAFFAAAGRLCRTDGRRPRGAAPLGEAVLADARKLAARLRDALAPLEALRGSRTVTVKAAVEAEIAALSAILRDEDGSDHRLVDGPSAGALARLFAGVLEAEPEAAGVTLAPGEWPGVLSALMAGTLVRSSSTLARVSIWGPLEARLMTVDRLVIGGLNEGVWPPAVDTGPWLSRPMRAALGFTPPELRIGLSAHDFCEALGAPDVVLTRSLRREGAPTVPTRLLQRLTGLVGEAPTAEMTARGARYLDWARRLDAAPAVARVPRPEPKPPLPARPASLSVTEIETWIRDPYAIYARRVLTLAPLDGLGERPDFGTRGTVLHASLADFAATLTGPVGPAAIADLIAIGERHFEREFGAYPEIHALWWPRFKAAAAFFVTAFEMTRGDVERRPEVDGKLAMTAGGMAFTLRGRADRIDRLADGRLSIVDFKTGSAPTAKQIALMKTPQLPLEAVIARRGGFPDIDPSAEIADLVHVILKGVRGKDEIRSYEGYADKTIVVSLDETVAEAERRLIGLVEAYADPDKGYLSRAHPFRQGDRGDYDHLARVMEWSLGGDDGEAEA